nr:MAG TPA: hypothetical protein [Caudoviricetes sp.]
MLFRKSTKKAQGCGIQGLSNLFRVVPTNCGL